MMKCLKMYVSTLPYCILNSINVNTGFHFQKSIEEATLPERLTNKQLLSENTDYAVGIVVVGVISLLIFPGFLSENTGKHSLGSW